MLPPGRPAAAGDACYSRASREHRICVGPFRTEPNWKVSAPAGRLVSSGTMHVYIRLFYVHLRLVVLRARSSCVHKETASSLDFVTIRRYASIFQNSSALSGRHFSVIYYFSYFARRTVLHIFKKFY